MLLPETLPRLWRFALRLCRNTADGQDLVQLTCVRALERRNQWKEGTSLLSWLYAIAHSIWLNEIRARSLRQRGMIDNNDDWYEEIADHQTADLETHVLYKQVIQAVESLPEGQRVVMILVAVEGLSYQQAADVLALPIGTVMSRLARARQTIGERFTESPRSNQVPIEQSRECK